jgi:hypothetical protein
MPQSDSFCDDIEIPCIRTDGGASEESIISVLRG